MGLLQWENRYSVGVAAVDHEHKQLIELITRLYAEAAAQSDPDAIRSTR